MRMADLVQPDIQRNDEGSSVLSKAYCQSGSFLISSKYRDTFIIIDGKNYCFDRSNSTHGRKFLLYSKVILSV
jgi:hypothetical protein